MQKSKKNPVGRPPADPKDTRPHRLALSLSVWDFKELRRRASKNRRSLAAEAWEILHRALRRKPKE